MPLQRLKKVFRLSDSEADLLQASVALRIDPALGPVFGYLQGSNQRTFLTGPLAARLFGENENPLPWRPGRDTRYCGASFTPANLPPEKPSHS